ncbi:phosphoribosylformimino-5-aminoimidazole carboxamide ribotide isomerase [Hespellia stercorisuis]|uniref:1-(5-phosphoribosyl)-5-[(5-phosphoribosylamino)methylideneamino] imidazole-4-carboxamide isomerase n=1 Tax=Hespellia stercorisuis DSM 15480 TaxID=1121950 RepID=A0A1M6SC31_9FIRM|nr:phosphoribosylformimino-5-aminoimidazole carboxamide ribotide isomerase [Hespellia stercorisuis]SHK42189.1 1-(5-phosphoribosyl)-5-[(5-phosphoribosylamino)methylideneamino] imidazole-4-carboxamide isomerase [Hespellia stercorisuis DSM 15480]
MKFRPCIDIHNGTVKQIVGGSLKDQGDQADTNFASELGADYYAKRYRADGLMGGHIILLNPSTSEYYEATKAQAMKALAAYPEGLQIGGGIHADNAQEYIRAGASHVIVTSYVFQEGKIQWENLARLVQAVGREKIVLDLSCRKKDGDYYIVTDRWQTFTEVKLEESVLDKLAGCCDEFLVHGVDVEGKASGVELELVRLLSDWGKIPITYAGGIGSMEDLRKFEETSGGKLDFTIGSALDLFGGAIPYEKIARYNGAKDENR